MNSNHVNDEKAIEETINLVDKKRNETNQKYYDKKDYELALQSYYDCIKKLEAIPVSHQSDKEWLKCYSETLRKIAVSCFILAEKKGDYLLPAFKCLYTSFNYYSLLSTDNKNIFLRAFIDINTYFKKACPQDKATMPPILIIAIFEDLFSRFFTHFKETKELLSNYKPEPLPESKSYFDYKNNLKPSEFISHCIYDTSLSLGNYIHDNTYIDLIVWEKESSQLTKKINVISLLASTQLKLLKNLFLRHSIRMKYL